MEKKLRSPSSNSFEKGEKVLCYEPDPKKAKVLYDSKILGRFESKDKRGRRIIQYKVHFQGWSSSWDRKVNADFVLKDSEKNRQLQRDLAEKAQLYLGAYLYRKEGSVSSKKRRSRKSNTSATLDDSCGSCGGNNSSTSANASAVARSPPKVRQRALSEDNYSSGSTFEKHEKFSMKDDCETTDSCCSSIGSFHDEERVLLRISERLRQYLEYDHDMIVNYGKQHALPSRIPIVTILENFVKQSAIQLVFSTTQTENSRRRSTQQRGDKKERDFEKLVSTVSLLKEVADGLRIYFDFTLNDYLLYKDEKEHAASYLSEENLRNFSYVPSTGLSSDFLSTKCETEMHQAILGTTTVENSTESLTSAAAAAAACVAATDAATTPTNEEPQKRKLRSHRSDDCDHIQENCLSSIASTTSTSGASTPLHSNVTAYNINYLKSLQPPMTVSIPSQTKKFLQTLLKWRLLPTNAAPAPSMIFGAPHLARLIVKLPEFLNASAINDNKLKILLQHLDTFTNFLEAHKDWFNEENYARSNSSRTASTTAEHVNYENPEEKLTAQQEQQFHFAEEQEELETSNVEFHSKTTTTTTATTTNTTIAKTTVAI